MVLASSGMKLVVVSRSRLLLSKVERSKKHIEELHALFESFWRSNPHSIRFEDDLNARERIFYLATVEDIPLEVPNIIGDILHNLRSALDHLAYVLPLATGEKRRWTQFPIVDSSAEYMSSQVRRKVQIFRQDVVEAFDTIKPYKGGNDALWKLHALNKIDKHRLLVTACVSNTARSMTPKERSEIIARFKASRPNDPIPALSNSLIGTTPIPLNAGDKLYRVPHSELEQYMRFHFDIALNEPQIIQCKPVIEALHQMSKLVGRIIWILSSSFREPSFVFAHTLVSSLLGRFSGASPETFRQERVGRICRL